MSRRVQAMGRQKLSRSEANFLLSRVSRIEAYQRLRDAEELQPWRCVVCNAAVRRGYNDPCKCMVPDGSLRKV
jgi:hypothetical protein